MRALELSSELDSLLLVGSWCSGGSWPGAGAEA